MSPANTPERKLRFNLFEFAPHELSHSAFFAWLLEHADPNAPGPPELRGIAKRILRKAKAPRLHGTLEVGTEHSSGSFRFDIYIRDQKNQIVVIENKVSAIASKDQVQNYKIALPGAHLALISVAFDLDRDALPCPSLNVEDLLGQMRLDSGAHPLIADYVAWLDRLTQKRDKLRELIRSEDYPERALKEPEGQWFLMQEITCCLAGNLYRGSSRGAPWTQFGFTLGPGEGETDNLFYRIDHSRKGWYFALRQFQHTPYPNIDAKLKRLERLRRWWQEALGAVGSDLRAMHWTGKGKKESTVAIFDLKRNPPRLLKAEIKAVHHEFLEVLQREGWPVEHSPSQNVNLDRPSS